MYDISKYHVAGASRIDVCFYYAPGGIIWRSTGVDRTGREASALIPTGNGGKRVEVLKLSYSCPSQLSKQRCQNRLI